MNNQQFERLIQNLQDIMRCPHCSAKYTPEDIHYLGQLDAMTFLHMRCHGCATPVFASVALANDSGEIMSADISAGDIAFSDMSATETAEEAPAGFAHKVIEGAAGPREVPVENLSVEELFGSLNPVSYDDVLDTHEYLKSFDGDFNRILR